MRSILSLVIFWQIFFIHFIISQSFTSPAANSNYAVGSTATVRINFESSTSPISVTQDCGGTVTTQAINPSNPSSTFTLPSGSFSSCTYRAASMTSVSINVLSASSRRVTIQTPSSSPTAIIAAGTSTNVVISYSGSGQTPISASIVLVCGSTMSSTQAITGTSMSFLVPNNFIGNVCTFSAIASGYASTHTVAIIVTQPLAFSSPANNSNFTINNSIPVRITTGGTNVFNSIELLFTCFTPVNFVPNIFNVTTSSATVFDYNYPNSAYGSCTLSINRAPSYFLLPSPLSINLKYTLTITPPSVIYVGQNFLVTVSYPSSIAISTVALNLVQGSSIRQTFPTVAINQQVTLTASTSLLANSGYTLQIAANTFLNQVTSSSFSVTSVQLTFSSPSTNSKITINSPIPIRMSTSPISVTASVELQFTCSAPTSVSPQWFNVTTSSATAYDYNYPASAYGACSLIVFRAPSYFVRPTPLRLNLKYTLTITPPTIIYIGQSFLVTVSNSTFCAISTVALNLVQGGSILQTFPIVAINQQVTLTASSTLSPGAGYTLQIAANDYLNQVASNSFPVSNVQLTFSSPSNNTNITINSPIPISLSTGAIAVTTSVELRFTCSTPPSFDPDFFNVTTSSAVFNYVYPAIAFGACTLSVNRAPSYFVLPSPLSLNLKYTLTITPPDVIYVGQNFLVTISYPSSIAISTVALNLVQGGVIRQTFPTVAINQQVTLTASTSLLANSGYTLQIAENEFLNQVTSKSFSVENVQLRFAEPSSGTYLFTDPIPILIDSVDVPVILPSNQLISVTLTCETTTVDTFDVIIGSQFNYINPNNGTGLCTLSTASPVSYLLSPSSLLLSIKYFLEFTQAPSTIYVGEPFTIELDAAGSPSTSDAKATVQLLCNGGQVKATWLDVLIGQQNTLTFDPSDTPVKKIYSTLASSPINDSYNESPTSGNLYSITQE